MQGILQSAFVLCNKSQNLHRHIMDHNSEFSFRDSLLQCSWLIKKHHINKTRTASPVAIPYSRGKIAKQAAPVNGQDERRIRAAVDKCRLFCFVADKTVKPRSA